MIGKLSGRIDSISGAHAIIDVGGVGYVVMCSSRSLREMAVGEATSLRIETHVREDAINLYGFISAEEQDWFKLLTTVQGVGAKVALAILGALSPTELVQAIAAQDKTAMTRADGVGPKLGLRLVTELKDKVPAFMASPIKLASAASAGTLPPSVAGDALSALMNLGYRRTEAYAAVTAACAAEPSASLDSIIRASLTALSRRENAA